MRFSAPDRIIQRVYVRCILAVVLFFAFSFSRINRPQMAFAQSWEPHPLARVRLAFELGNSQWSCGLPTLQALAQYLASAHLLAGNLAPFHDLWESRTQYELVADGFESHIEVRFRPEYRGTQLWAYCGSVPVASSGVESPGNVTTVWLHALPPRSSEARSEQRSRRRTAVFQIRSVINPRNYHPEITDLSYVQSL